MSVTRMQRGIILVLLHFCLVSANSNFLPWTYQCDEYHRCSKDSLAYGDTLNKMSLAECKLTCNAEDSVLWPRPREAEIGTLVIAFHPDDIAFTNIDEIEVENPDLADKLRINLVEQLGWMTKKKIGTEVARPVGINFSISVHLEDYSEPVIRRDTNETYALLIEYSDADKTLLVDIVAENYFGARHAIETLFQLTEYDDVSHNYIILGAVAIRDYPEFRHRGITLDTARNYITVDVIKRILDGMAQSKLNVLHWHIVDSHSFPLQFGPEYDPLDLMSQYGAYDASKVYNEDQVKDILRHATFRGVRVIPELDQPAHVGNGWQFPGAEHLTVCRNAEPWYNYCVEPPCGQLDPTKDDAYDLLRRLYRAFFQLFKFDSFHMGASEVNFDCWRSSPDIAEFMESEEDLRSMDDKAFVKVWSAFQARSSSDLRQVVAEEQGEDEADLEVIVWTSRLTKRRNLGHLPPKKYVVQVWTNASDTEDTQIATLAKRGYRMIFSNVDALYMDCGYGAWVGDGNNWCSPYKGWQQVYTNDPYKLLADRGVRLTEKTRELVLGGEVAMWSEQVDSETVEGKLFPRASALGERLWSSPDSAWFLAEQRMLQHRLRLTQRGVGADALQPEWCRVNEKQCYVEEDYTRMTNIHGKNYDDDDDDIEDGYVDEDVE